MTSFRPKTSFVSLASHHVILFFLVFCFFLHVYISGQKFHWVLMPRRKTHKRTQWQGSTRWKPSQKQISGMAEFHFSVNKQACLSVVCIRETERRCCCLQLFLISGAQQGIRVGETEGNNRLEEREGAGPREFAGSLVYSVVVLTSGWTPAVRALVPRSCPCRGAWNAADLYVQTVQLCVCLCV